MLSYVTSDYQPLAWKSSSLLYQDSKQPTTGKRLSFSELWKRHERSHTRFYENWKYISSFGRRHCLERYSLNIVSLAGRSKPRNPQPIRPRRRRKVDLPTGHQPDPGGNIPKKRTSSAPKNATEPYIRYDDDYYKFGPFGPYNYKARVEGTLIPVTSFTDDYVVMWSTIKDLKHYEQVEIEDACIEYHNRVQYFNQQIGVKYFYVFVRCTYNYGPEPPWKQWTLVAEVAVESAEDLDKEIVISKLTNSIRNRITQYTSWFRPDLIHVKPKRRRYQARFEPELEFIGELKKIFYQSAGESDESDSYYGKFCHILGEDVNASAEEISSKFEAASEEVKLACLEHLLTQHPIELLHYIPYPRRSIWSAQQPSREGDSVKSSRISMDNESIAENDNDPDDDHSDNDELEGEEDGNMAQYENWDDLDDDEIESRLNRGADDLSDDEPQGMDSSELEEDVIDSDDNGDMRIGDQGRGLPVENSFLKAAARPYTYVNFVREMAVLHEIILERKRRKRSKMTVLE